MGPDNPLTNKAAKSVSTTGLKMDELASPCHLCFRTDFAAFPVRDCQFTSFRTDFSAFSVRKQYPVLTSGGFSLPPAGFGKTHRWTTSGSKIGVFAADAWPEVPNGSNNGVFAADAWPEVPNGSKNGVFAADAWPEVPNGSKIGSFAADLLPKP